MDATIDPSSQYGLGAAARLLNIPTAFLEAAARAGALVVSPGRDGAPGVLGHDLADFSARRAAAGVFVEQARALAAVDVKSMLDELSPYTAEELAQVDDL